MKKLVITSMNNTFLNSSKQYNRMIFRKIYQYLHNQEILFVVASQHPYHQLKPYFDDDLDIIFISDNGASITQNHQILYQQFLPDQNLHNILNYLLSHDYQDICLHGKESTYLLNGHLESYKDFSQYCQSLEMIQTKDEIHNEILKISLKIKHDLTLISSLQQFLRKDCQVINNGDGYIDLIAPHHHKGYALHQLCQLYNMDLSECVAFGCHENDIEMLYDIQNSYAVNNAPLHIQHNVSHICDGCDHHGVLKTLVDIFNIPLKEEEKALIEMWYDANHDAKIVEDRNRIHQLCYEYNHTHRNDLSVLSKILNQELDNVTVLAPFYCDCGNRIHIGKNVFINFNSYLMDGATITIGDNVFIGPHVGLYTAIHPLDYKTRNIGLEKAKPITIGDNVWIGGNVTILPGVTVGNGSVIGAGSVVNKDIPDNVLAFGNPCRVVKNIDQNHSFK